MNTEINIGKISNVKIWITDNHMAKNQWSAIKKFLLIKIKTSDGVEGWGEAFTINLREKAIVNLIAELSQEISNIENLTLKSFYQKIFILSDGHRGLDFCAATSAIEIALWDITGKIKNLPLNSLLTNKPKLNVSIYATCWSSLRKNTDQYLNQIQNYLDKEYSGIKVYPMKDNLKSSIKFVEQARELVGEEYPLMLDLAIPENLDNTMIFLKEVSSLKPYWIEEPVDGENISMLSEIKNNFGMKVVTGEKQCGLPHFQELISRGAVDILNPDISGVGGIIDMIKISEESLNYNISISPHCWNSMSVSASAMLHVCASISNSEMAEIFPDYIEFSKEFCELSFEIENNEAYLNQKPGLGIVIDEKSLSELSEYITEVKINA